MALAVLLQTSRVSAEATVERLQALAIDAQVIDHPNVFAKFMSFGSYRVRVAVPEAELARAQLEIERWASEARPRVRELAREVQLGLLIASLPALALCVGLVLARAESALLWLTVVPVWFAGLLAWARWDQSRAAKNAALDGRKEGDDGFKPAPPSET